MLEGVCVFRPRKISEMWLLKSPAIANVAVITISG
jgi:hypothetical protein